MDIFFAIIFLCLLLVLSIALLHRHQQRKAREFLERSDPLKAPELDFSASDLAAMTPPETDDYRKQVPEQPGTDPANQRSWQEQARELREAGHFSQALRLCQDQFPRSQAFQQAMVILRAELRQCRQQHSPIDVPLGNLYRTAVLADLFRKGSASAKTPKSQAGDTLASRALNDLSISYSQIGYRELKLLNKTDISLLVELWGEPARHCHAEASLGADWQNQLQLFSEQ